MPVSAPDAPRYKHTQPHDPSSTLPRLHLAARLPLFQRELLLIAAMDEKPEVKAEGEVAQLQIKVKDGVSAS